MNMKMDGNVGVARKMTMEPKLKNALGMLDVNNDNLDELKDANLFTVAELLSPLGASRDDSVRTAILTSRLI